MRTLITNARIVDGTGAPAREGEVLIEDGAIAAAPLVFGEQARKGFATLGARAG